MPVPGIQLAPAPDGDLLSAASLAAIPLLDRAIGLDLGWLVVLAVIGAVFDPAGVTARETMLPAAAGRAGWPLERVNGLHEAIWGLAFILGPGVGGVLIAWVGAIDAMWVTTIGFALSALFVSLLRVPHAGAPIVADDAPEGVEVVLSVPARPAGGAELLALEEVAGHRAPVNVTSMDGSREPPRRCVAHVRTAEASHLSITEFVVQAARASAAQTLADRDHIVLDAKTWDGLDRRVSRKGRRNPKTVELFERPSPFKK